MAKTLISDPIWVPRNFFHGFYLYWQLDMFQAIIQRNYIVKVMKQTWGNKKNLILDSILACLVQIWAHKFFGGFTSSRFYKLFQPII